jgi:hypothetical protein
MFKDVCAVGVECDSSNCLFVQEVRREEEPSPFER